MSTGLKCLNGGCIENGAALFHYREGRFCKVEHCEDVRAERALPFFGTELLDLFVTHLERGVVHQDVEAAELLLHLLDELAAVLFLLNVSRKHQTLAASLCYPVLR